MTRPSASDIAETLRCAADLLVAHGWIQGDYGGDSCGYCMSGALSAALRRPSSDDSWDANCTALDAVIEDYRGFVHWNDAPGRTVDEVIGALLEAAARLEGY